MDHPLPAFEPVSDRRREDIRFVTGRGEYVADLIESDALHAAFVRSQEAHAIITGIDRDMAQDMPGVVAIWTAADLNLPDHPGGTAAFKVENMDRPVLARDRVRYVSEPIAVVIAETARQAVDAADMVWVDYEPLSPVMDIDAAMADETLLHPDAGTNVWLHSAIGVDRPDFASHEVDIAITVMNDRLGPSSIEPNGIYARPLGDGAEVWVSAQGTHRIRAPIQEAVGFPVEVHAPDVGGGFGMKGPWYPEYGPVTHAAKHFQRPVAWVQTRREHLLGGTHGRSQQHTVRLAGDRSGRIRAAYVRIVGDVGAYGSSGGQVSAFSRRVSLGQYDIADAGAEFTVVVTNKAPTGPYRGAGRPESAFAIERAIETYADACGLDSADVRMMNYVSSFPHQTTTDALYDSGDYHATLRQALELVDIDAVRAEQSRRRETGEDPIGVGIGSFVERAGGPIQGGEFGRTTVNDDGTVTIDTGSVSNGQGHETVWARIAAEALRVPIDHVTVRRGDTTTMPRSSGTSASRSTQLGGSAVWVTAETVRERAKTVAADLLEADVADIDVADGMFSVVGVPGSGVSYGEVARHALTIDVELTEDTWFAPGAQTFPYGSHVAVVEVEVETGEVKLLKIVAVDDCGNILSPMIVEGQIHGSLMQGIGQALYEDIDYSPDGQLRTSTFMDYQLPRAADQPPFLLGRVISPAPSNPLGAKGTGEAGCIGAPPAIVNAVLDALKPFGVTNLRMPLKPATVWAAIQAARHD